MKQTDKQTAKQTAKQTEKQTETDRETDKETDSETDRETYRKPYRQRKGVCDRVKETLSGIFLYRNVTPASKFSTVFMFAKSDNLIRVFKTFPT